MSLTLKQMLGHLFCEEERKKDVKQESPTGGNDLDFSVVTVCIRLANCCECGWLNKWGRVRHPAPLLLQSPPHSEYRLHSNLQTRGRTGRKDCTYHSFFLFSAPRGRSSHFANFTTRHFIFYFFDVVFFFFSKVYNMNPMVH